MLSGVADEPIFASGRDDRGAKFWALLPPLPHLRLRPVPPRRADGAVGFSRALPPPERTWRFAPTESGSTRPDRGRAPVERRAARGAGLGRSGGYGFPRGRRGSACRRSASTRVERSGKLSSRSGSLPGSPTAARSRAWRVRLGRSRGCPSSARSTRHGRDLSFPSTRSTPPTGSVRPG